ncbi:MAG: DUF4262 domain-containing protein [Nitrospirae bacterium]|nr:DUF4262 domain-containing protein [Nitrospirota bacterium]
MTVPPDSDRSAVGDRQVIHDVNTVGWHVVQVTPQGAHHGWAFSIGLFHTFRHPEVVVFGLPDDVMATLIQTIGHAIRSGGSFQDGQENLDLMRPYRCVFRAVDPVWSAPVLAHATWFYGGQEFPALQLFWPDREHRFPWEEVFDPELVSFQPVLFHREPQRAGTLRWVRSP